MRLEAAGYMSRRSQAVSRRRARRRSSRRGSADEFTYRGALDRAGKLAFLRGLDVLSVPATYDEPKGMFLLEAMASGVPVVQPRRGAFIEMVERTGGGLLVEPDDPTALADGLLRAVERSRATRRRLAERAFDGVRAHYTIAQSADRLLDGLRESPAARRQLPMLDVAARRQQALSDAARAADGAVGRDASSLAPGEAAAITGPSGSGKSSLLYMLGALEPPSAGTVTLGGRNPFALAARGARRLPQRGDRVRVPGSLPAAAVLGARERARADAGGATGSDERRTTRRRARRR